MVKMVTVGNATISAPSLSLRFASSDAATMTVAVIKYFVISQPISYPQIQKPIAYRFLL